MTGEARVVRARVEHLSARHTRTHRTVIVRVGPKTLTNQHRPGCGLLFVSNLGVAACTAGRLTAMSESHTSAVIAARRPTDLGTQGFVIN